MITIGVDLGIRKAAYSIWDDEVLRLTGAYEAAAGLERAQQLYCVSEWLGEIIYEQKGQGGLNVFVEQPLVGNNVKYSLSIAMTYGAVLSEIGWMRTEGSAGIYGVNVGEWKKGTVGNGNAGKEDVKNYIHGINSSYAALCGDDQDRVDAACIGLYGCRVSARADGLLATQEGLAES